MSWENNPRYSPEKFGLEMVGEVQWGEAYYNFDLTAVWRKGRTFYYADDSGCSCPSPFEDYHTLEDLTKATRHQVLKHLEERRKDYPNDGMDLIEKLASLK